MFTTWTCGSVLYIYYMDGKEFRFILRCIVTAVICFPLMFIQEVIIALVLQFFCLQNTSKCKENCKDPDLVEALNSISCRGAYCGFVVSRRRNQHSTLLERSLKACVAMSYLPRKNAFPSIIFLWFCVVFCVKISSFLSRKLKSCAGVRRGKFSLVSTNFPLFSRLCLRMPIDIVHVVRMLVMFFDSFRRSIVTRLFVVEILLTTIA